LGCSDEANDFRLAYACHCQISDFLIGKWPRRSLRQKRARGK
jgi:hypothetical protein